MAKYVMLLNWTDQGVKAAKDTVKRSRAAAAAFEKVGIKLLHALWTLGQYDLLLIVDAPDDQTMTAMGLQLGVLGNVRSCTLRAFDEQEMEQVLKKI